MSSYESWAEIEAGESILSDGIVECLDIAPENVWKLEIILASFFYQGIETGLDMGDFMEQDPIDRFEAYLLGDADGHQRAIDEINRLRRGQND